MTSKGAMVHGSFFGAIASGPTSQPRLWLWAWHKHKAMRPWLLLEGTGIVLLIVLAVVAVRWTPGPLVYVALVIAGSWLFPLVTVYIPHDALEQDPLRNSSLSRTNGPIDRVRPSLSPRTSPLSSGPAPSLENTGQAARPVF